ncbi:MAG: hypothetical protein GX817_02510, partial [Elusimicrobia bacterium]|nr:hypothetical protein [Elusimicrobiota bacterium]
MERAYFYSSPPTSKNIPSDSERIYFGNEFCEYLIPSEKNLNKALKSALDNGLEFTFLTAYAGDEMFFRYSSLIKMVAELSPGSEVVINDWGLLKTVQKFGLEPVLG